MNPETLDNYLKAGQIAAQALEYGRSLIKPNAKVIEILDQIETKILALGGQLAFPAQISLNEVAAHSCSDLNDQTTLTNQIVKLDIGVHLQGCIADTALTVDLSGKHQKLVLASQQALNEALKLATPGTNLAEIGQKIHEIITFYGFAPVKNLSGHGLEEYNIHAPPSIPNFNNGSQITLKEGQVIAIEPFASTGAGFVQESSPPTVFSLIRERPVRDPITRNILQEIKTYQDLPFAKRWLERKFGAPKTNFALKILLQNSCLQPHPPLFDQNRGLISQAEHSLIVKDTPIVFTQKKP